MFCFLQRWKIDRALDEGDALTPRLEAHVTRCVDCHRHYEQQHAVVNRLEQSAQLPVPEAPAFLRSRVMNALRDEESVPAPVRWGVAAWAPVAVVAAIALVGNLAQQRARTAEVVRGFGETNRLNAIRVSSGLDSKLDLVDNDVRLLDAQLAQANLAAEAASQRVALVLALGGGFSPQEPRS